MKSLKQTCVRMGVGVRRTDLQVSHKRRLRCSAPSLLIYYYCIITIIIIIIIIIVIIIIIIIIKSLKILTTKITSSKT